MSEPRSRGGFFEEDEPVEKIAEAYEHGTGGVTAPLSPDERRDRARMVREIIREYQESDEYVDPDTCDHEGEPVRKFDGGRLPLLCPKCYIILGYNRG